MELALDTIIIDEELRVRSLHPDVVDRYAEILTELPPVDVFVVGEEYLLAGGFHRLAAAQQLDWQQIPVTLHHGTREEALIYALTANAQHGVPLTKEEDLRAMIRLAQLYGFQFHDSGIEPYGVVTRVARELGHSIRVVDIALRSNVVRQTVPIAGLVTPTKLEAISRAPEETWEPLVRAAYHGAWPMDEIVRRAQAVRAGKPLDEVVDRPVPRYYPPEQPTPDPEHDNLEDYMELSRAMGRFDPYLTVGRYDWRDVSQVEGNIMCSRLGLMRMRLERVMAFLMGQGYEPSPTAGESEPELIEV